ncbi:hypothetical protein HPB50_016747 [Hyalomma asiaticum]|uniref:Uncharacterized protein n=1 Tax=Hyalomma asiaticum TaxID=266040 RepID=A0ACB7SXC1_HYAAI|nr:hypothetical protein HPB50_016747 [Hyalomma asiaticum]
MVRHRAWQTGKPDRGGRNVKRPPTKLSLKNKKPNMQQLPSTSQRKGDFEQSESITTRDSSSDFTSSCEIPRRLLKDDDSFLVNFGSPVNPTSSTPKNYIKCGNMVYKDSIEQSGLIVMNSMDSSSLRFLDSSKEPCSEQTHAASGAVLSVHIPEKRTSWVTIRKNRNRTNLSCDDEANRTGARPSFESAEASNSVWDSPVTEEWSPVLVSTPLSNAQVNMGEARKRWFLSSVVETPRVATTAKCNGLVSAQASVTRQEQVQGTRAHQARCGVKRKLSSVVHFQVPPLESHSGLSWESVSESEAIATSQLRDNSGHTSYVTNSSRSELPCSITLVPCIDGSAELFVSQQTQARTSDVSIGVAHVQEGASSKLGTTFKVDSVKLDTLGSRGSSDVLQIKETEPRVLMTPKASCQMLGNDSQLFTKELRVTLIDIMKTSNADKECLRSSSLSVAQTCSEETSLSKEIALQETFKLKDLHVVLTDMKHQAARLIKNVQYCSPYMSSPIDRNDSIEEIPTLEKFQVKHLHIILEDVRSRSETQNKRSASPINGNTVGIFSTNNPLCTTCSDDIVQSSLTKDRALWEKFQLKDVRVILRDLKDLSATKQQKNEAHMESTFPWKEPLAHELLCPPFAHVHLQSPSSSPGLQCNNSASLDAAVSPMHQRSNPSFQQCPGESSEAKWANHLNSKSGQMEQVHPRTNDKETTKNAHVRKSSAGHYENTLGNEALSLPSVALTCKARSKVDRTTDDLVVHVAPRPHTSSKRETDFEQMLEPWSSQLKEVKVVLRKCTQLQPMQPPPLPISKKRVMKSLNCSNTQRADRVQERRITASSCKSLQNKSACKKENRAACMRRQARLTMARKSAIPSRVPLDASQTLLDMCYQKKALTFKEALGTRAFKECVKIGEGAYGEVFRIGHGSDASAIKIVPIEGSFPVNGENQKTASQILPEAIICQYVTTYHGALRMHVGLLYYIQDRYHPALLKQWDVYNSERTSENDRPDCFKADQKFLMFQFSDGGTSLEDYEINSATEARSIFLQVACALAVAESALEFEHRDLHWGNVLVAPVKQRSIRCHLPQGSFTLETNGVLASVIDYTLSRLHKGGAVVFTDLSQDEMLFRGVGDYQFDIYRHMKEHNQNDWKSFKPYTNALWLHYLSCKLLEKCRSSARSRQQSSALAELGEWSNKLILQCPSSVDIFLKCIGTQSREKRAGVCVSADERLFH